MASEYFKYKSTTKKYRDSIEAEIRGAEWLRNRFGYDVEHVADSKIQSIRHVDYIVSKNGTKVAVVDFKDEKRGDFLVVELKNEWGYAGWINAQEHNELPHYTMFTNKQEYWIIRTSKLKERVEELIKNEKFKQLRPQVIMNWEQKHLKAPDLSLLCYVDWKEVRDIAKIYKITE